MKKIATIFMVLSMFSIAFSAVDVTFTVNTCNYSGATDSTVTIQVRGNTAPLTWDDQSVTLTENTGDYWTGTVNFDVTEGTSIAYKYVAIDKVTGATAWEAYSGDRTATLTGSSMILPVDYFNLTSPPYTPTDAIDVWFRVSTAGIIGYAGETMNVRGSLSPLDWGANFSLTQEGSSAFWSGLISFPATDAGTTVSYKFLQGDGWESIVGDRSLVLGADTTLAFKYFSDTPPVSDIDTFEVTIVMNTSTMDNITDSTALFFVTGSYDGWAHDDDTLTIVGDYASKTFEFVGPSSGLDLEFTFFYKMLATIDQQNWQGGDNLKPQVTSDTTLVYYWQNGNVPPYTPTDSIDVWFRVNMAGVPDYDGTSPVGVRGSIPVDPTWEHAAELTQEGTTDYYSGLVSFPIADIGDTIQYKFVWGPLAGWDNVHWEAPKIDTWPPDGNRYFFVGKDTTLAFKYFNDEPPAGIEPQTAYVVFSVDMAAYIELGLFSEARKDSMQIRGTFNGWNDGNPLKSKMTKQPGTTVYSIIAEVTDFPGKEIQYKYYMKMSQESLTFWANQGITDIHVDWGYEVPPTRGGGNRLIVFEGDPSNYQILDVEAYNGLALQGVIPAGHTVPVTFTIDMNGAPLFNAATDSVLFYFKDEWQVNALGLRGDKLKYTDANNDGIYEITIDFVGPTAYTLIYTVGFEGPENAIEEGGGFEFGRFRCRYIQPTTIDPVTWPTAYSTPMDTFTENPPLDVETPPLSILKIDDDDMGVPEKFALSQNYPNPFNPTTSIRFMIPRSDIVTLTIYNMLGKIVSKVVYNNLQIGNYTYMWNGTDLHGSPVASGVYFYELNVGNQFRDIKKMVLMK